MPLEWLTDEADWYRLAEEWNALLDRSVQPLPFLRHEYLRVWWETRGAGEWKNAQLAVAVYRDVQGTLQGAAGFFIAPTRLGPTMFLLGSHRLTDYLGVLVAPEAQDGFFRALGRALFGPNPVFPQVRRWEWWNVLPQNPLRSASEVWAQAYGLDILESPVEVAPYIALPRSWEAYLNQVGKKQRHEIRRKLRRIQNAGTVAWYKVTQEHDLDKEMDTFFHLLEGREDKALFFTPERRAWLRRTVAEAHKHGWLFLAFLTLNGEPAAAFLGFDFHKRLWIYNSGLNPAFHALSPGWVLLAYILQWAIAREYKELDFMRGPETYKYRFGAQNRTLTWIRLHKPA